MLALVRHHLPIHTEEWNLVAQRLHDKFPQHSRTGDSLRKKFYELYKKVPTTGASEIPPINAQALEIRDLIIVRSGNNDAESNEELVDQMFNDREEMEELSNMEMPALPNNSDSYNEEKDNDSFIVEDASRRGAVTQFVRQSSTVSATSSGLMPVMEPAELLPPYHMGSTAGVRQAREHRMSRTGSRSRQQSSLVDTGPSVTEQLISSIPAILTGYFQERRLEMEERRLQQQQAMEERRLQQEQELALRREEMNLRLAEMTARRDEERNRYEQFLALQYRDRDERKTDNRKSDRG